MNKRLLVTILLCVGILAGWTWLQHVLWPVPPRTPSAPRSGTAAPAVPAAPRPAPAPPPPAPGAMEPAVEMPLTSERISALVASRGGTTLRRLESWGCLHHAPGDRSVSGDPGVVTGYVEGRDAALTVTLAGAGVDDLATASWALEKTEDGSLRATAAGERPVVVRSTLGASHDPAHPYHLVWSVEVENVRGKAAAPCVLELVGPWMPTAPTSVIPEDGVIVAPVGDDVEQLLSADVAEELQKDAGHELRSAEGWRFVGIRSDFYLAALLPAEGTTLPASTAVGFRSALVRAVRPADPPVHTAAATLRIPFDLPPAGGRTSWTFLLYAGPNNRDVLAAPGAPYGTLRDAFPNRKFIGLSFGPIARFLGWLLSILADRVGLGWGLAVCALTVLVRGVLFPLSKKTQVSMRVHAQRMGKLKPKLDALKTKYADNPKKQQEMTMRLFREEKVSILPGGCLLAFAQMPVWISLYATLQTTFQMRHASFLWFDDLTMPDHVAEIPWMRGVWGLGTLTDGWFNVLPLLMMVTWWGSAAMQPLPEDPEQRAQAKMMRFIPLLFGVMLYRTAAGLTLYMTLSALWSIGESWLIRTVWLKKLGLDKVGTAAGPTP
jgi:YidC/Oxa1 family membrane protein insertase